MASHIPLPGNSLGFSLTKAVRGFCPPTLPYRVSDMKAGERTCHSPHPSAGLRFQSRKCPIGVELQNTANRDMRGKAPEM